MSGLLQTCTVTLRSSRACASLEGRRPRCRNDMAPHAHDASRGEADTKIQSQTPVAMTCPNGHRFSAATENLLRFEWGAQ
jgi:hypothetical protein